MAIWCEDKSLVEMAQYRVQWSAVVLAVLNLVFCYPGVVTSTLQVLWQALTYKCNAITATCKDVY